MNGEWKEVLGPRNGARWYRFDAFPTTNASLCRSNKSLHMASLAHHDDRGALRGGHDADDRARRLSRDWAASTRADLKVPSQWKGFLG